MRSYFTFLGQNYQNWFIDFTEFVRDGLILSKTDCFLVTK